MASFCVIIKEYFNWCPQVSYYIKEKKKKSDAKNYMLIGDGSYHISKLIAKSNPHSQMQELRIPSEVPLVVP